MDVFTRPIAPRTPYATVPHFYANQRFIRLTPSAQQALIRLWLEASMRGWKVIPRDGFSLIYWMGETYDESIVNQWTADVEELRMNGFFLANETDERGQLADWEHFGAVQNSNERRAATSRSSALVRWHNAGKHAGNIHSDCSLCSSTGDVQ